MVKEWKIARYVLDAKMATDSLWFIGQHSKGMYKPEKLCKSKRSDYYINICVVLDKTICKKSGKKKELSASYPIVERLYRERDKHYAHKDENYILSFPWSSIEQEALSYQQELSFVRDLCKEYLPKKFTLNYVCYDSELFRMIEKISPKEEEKIMRHKYPLYPSRTQETLRYKYSFKLLQDVDELNNLTDEEKKNYGVIFENGLTFEESLQLQQEACIKINILFDENIWCSPNQKVWKECIDLREHGFFDKFGCINLEKVINEINKQEKSYELFQY